MTRYIDYCAVIILSTERVINETECLQPFDTTVPRHELQSIETELINMLLD